MQSEFINYVIRCKLSLIIILLRTLHHPFICSLTGNFDFSRSSRSNWIIFSIKLCDFSCSFRFNWIRMAFSISDYTKLIVDRMYLKVLWFFFLICSIFGWVGELGLKKLDLVEILGCRDLKEAKTVFKSLIAINSTKIIIFQDEYSSLGGNPCARKLKG